MDLDTVLADFFTYDDLHHIVYSISEALGCPLILFDSAFHTVAWACQRDFRDPVFYHATHHQEASYEFIAMMKQRDGENSVGFTNVPDSSFRWRFSALRHGGILLGYFVCADLQNNLEQDPPDSLPQFEAIISKQLFFDLHRRQLVSDDAEEVLCHLLDGEYTDEAHFQIQAASTGLADWKIRRIALIDLETYHNLNFVDDTLRRELQCTFEGSHPFLYGEEILLLLHSGHDCRLLHDTDYCRTLLSYLLNNHSLKKTCEELFIHRNTVLHRITKMKEDFGIDMDGTSRRLNLMISAAMAVYQRNPSLFAQDRAVVSDP